MCKCIICNRTKACVIKGFQLAVIYNVLIYEVVVFWHLILVSLFCTFFLECGPDVSGK